MSEKPRVAIVVADLMFGSKLRRLDPNVAVDLRRSADALEDDLAGVAVDLTVPGALEAAAAWRERTGRPACGFGPHVEADRLRAARAAGLDPVWPRSTAVEGLRDWLAALQVERPGDR